MDQNESRQRMAMREHAIAKEESFYRWIDLHSPTSLNKIL